MRKIIFFIISFFFTIPNHSQIVDTTAQSKRIIELNEIYVTENSKELGNIKNFKNLKSKNSYNISKLPKNRLVGVVFFVKEDCILKSLQFHSPKSENSFLPKIKLFKIEGDNYKELTVVNRNDSDFIKKGINSIDLDFSIESGKYFLALEPENKDNDCLITIGRVNEKNVDRLQSYFFQIDEATEKEYKLMPIMQGNNDTSIELMISILINY